jgi:hypothetical protein
MEDLIKKTEGQQLCEWMDAVPKNEFKQTWRTIMANCGVEYYTVINWRNDRCRIPQRAKEKIEAIAGRKIFDTI